MRYYTIFAFLFLTYFTLYDTLHCLSFLWLINMVNFNPSVVLAQTLQLFSSSMFLGCELPDDPVGGSLSAPKLNDMCEFSY